MTESAGNDTLTGNAANNKFNGLAGNDIIKGLAGADALQGSGGADTLIGGAGSDTLMGGIGNDRLTGGGGQDSFRFNTAIVANVDKITDFNVLKDTIQLDNAIFTQLASTGVLAATHFITGGAARDADDYLIYKAATGVLSYDADGNGAGLAVSIAVLGLHLALTPADFMVI
jgi:Ca2+-binding RTX toxin-like protein